MKSLLLPLLLVLLGVGGGAGAGFFLRPPPPETTHAEDGTCPPAEEAVVAETPDATPTGSEYVKLNNQFVVPIIEDGSVRALVILSLSVEVAAGEKPIVYEHEPKLRDGFNDVMFVHANSGGFTGTFTDTPQISRLRLALTDIAQDLLGSGVKAVLIDSIMRQDMS